MSYYGTKKIGNLRPQILWPHDGSETGGGYLTIMRLSSFKWGMAVAPSTAALALLRPPDAPENK